MSTVITLTDVQHWVGCQQVTLVPGAVLTEAAQRWVAERGIEVRVAEETKDSPRVCTSDEDAGIGDAKRVVITVVGRDRVGITAAFTGVLSEFNVNVLDINQTLFGDLFSMNMDVDVSQANVSFPELKRALEDTAEKLHLKALVQRDTVFYYMHRV